MAPSESPGTLAILAYGNAERQIAIYRAEVAWKSVGLLTDTAFYSLTQPWLIVDRVNEFELDAEQHGHITGTGDRLLISQGSEAVLFVGDPDEQIPAVVQRSHEGRMVQMEVARVRVRNDVVVHLSALGAFEDRSIFLSPTMTLHEPGSRSLLSHMRAVCRGDIHVEPDAVRFDGSVEAYGLTPDGQDDPDGIHIDAIEMVMNRHTSGKEIGKVKDIQGRDVIIDWTRLDARADLREEPNAEKCDAGQPQRPTRRRGSRRGRARRES